MIPTLTVLVTDDSPAMRTLLAAILTARGHQVVLAEDTPCALNLLCALRPDVILTDYNMPGANGVDLVRWVRAQGRLDAVPVFVVSSETAPESRSRMAAAGANGWLTKPICVATLLTAVEAVEAVAVGRTGSGDGGLEARLGIAASA